MIPNQLPYAPFTTCPVRFKVVTDQTKKSNNPEEEQNGCQTARSATKSTSIRSEGPGSKSGEGPGQHTG